MQLYKRTVAVVLGSMAVSAGPVVANDGARNKPAYAAIDAATGAAVRVYRAPAGVIVEVEHPAVALRKQLVDGQTITELRAGNDAVVITMAREALTVAAGGRHVRVTRDRADRAGEARAILAGSAAARQAAALIGKMQFGADSPLRQSLLTTRALLLASAGDDSGAGELSRSIRQLEQTRYASRISKISAGQDLVSPSVCWTLYTVEAIGAYIEYEGCMNGEEWWDIFGQLSCAIIYDIRAIGAFAWWLSCVGLKS